MPAPQLHVAEEIYKRTLPHNIALDQGEALFERKPYLQPFEEALSLLELSRYCSDQPRIDKNSGLFIARPVVSESTLREVLVYWQRVGTAELIPTRQVLLESTQSESLVKESNGQLHNARRLRYGTHGLHEYRGKFFPQLVGSLLNIAGAVEGDVVLDPMCGSGTTIVEAVQRGMQGYGCDLNPLSTLMARTKAEILCKRPKNLESQTESLLLKVVKPQKIHKDHFWNDEDIAYLQKWFAPEALTDICSLLTVIRTSTSGTYRRFFELCLSDIVRHVSYQDVDDLRVRKTVKVYERGMAYNLFRSSVTAKASRSIRMLNLLDPASEAQIQISNGDARDIADIIPEMTGKIDVLITSPPYATALPYLDTDRLSLIVLGLDQRAKHKYREIKMIGTREVSERQRQEWWTLFESRSKELPLSVNTLVDQLAVSNHRDGTGFRRKNLPALLGAYFLSMLDSMISAHQLMRTAGKAFYVVGNNSTNVDGKRIEIRTNELLVDIAECAGWKTVEVIGMDLLASRDIFRQNRGTAESILMLEA